MAIASRENGSSTLNPNAPLFIPLAYQQVEDFSPEWWKLVQSSPWFRDYWLRERYEMFEEVECFADLFPETLEDEFSELEEELLLCSGVEDGEFFDGFDFDGTQHELDSNEENLALKTMCNGKPSKPKYEVKLPEKAPQIVNVKCSPRRIQQPR